MLTRNPPIDRLGHVIKLYGEKQPWVVLDTLSVIFPTIGIDSVSNAITSAIGPRRHSLADGSEAERALRKKLRQARALTDEMLTGEVVDLLPGLPKPHRTDPYPDAVRWQWFGHEDPEDDRYRIHANVHAAKDGLTALLSLAADPNFADGAMREPHEADRIFPWVARELSKLAKAVIATVEEDRTAGLAPWDEWKLTYLEALRQLRRSGNAIAQWSKLKRVDLMKMSLAEALEAIKGFRYSAKVRQGKVVYKYPSGWTVQELRGRSELEAEGKLLAHCVAGHCEAVDSGRSVIYSLRDPDGVPYVTLEWQPDAKSKSGGTFVQAFGHQNSTIGDPTFNMYVLDAGQENDPPLTEDQVPVVVDAIREMLVEFIDNVHSGEMRGLIAIGAPFVGRGLSGRNLSGINLSHMTLSSANLSGADLSDAKLIRTYLIGANLSGASLDHAELTYAMLSGADLRNASLVNADLRNADLRDAKLGGADLSGAEHSPGTRWPANFDMNRLKKSGDADDHP